jgi:pimeloyl-[acyl-carrier protein] methyl ester esterase
MDGSKEMTDRTDTGIVTAQHGWGYDWRTYAGWQAHLPAQWQLTLKNRGYFKDTTEKIIAPLKSPETHAWQVLVCHSFGLHLLNAEEIERADLLVIISSFGNFHIAENAQSKKAVKRMIKRLALEPLPVLQDFYAACTGESASLPDNFLDNCNLELLIADLKELDSAQAELSKIGAAKSILILHGAKDAIVPVKAAQQLYELMHGSFLAINETAGHALPLSNPEWCLEQIFEYLDTET